jgi:branched-chain amino acid transport system substrate-binding protein
MRRLSRSRFIVLVALLVAGALFVAACGRDDSSTSGGEGGSDPGITKTEVKLGGSYPFSGPASAYKTIADGAKAYFKKVNAEGGVNGRKIKFVTLDDAYEPPRAVQNARRLVEQEKVFAMFNTLGTPNNLAIWNYLNQKKVPHLFVATGASQWGADIKAHPYTIGWQPDYVTEAGVYADYLKKEKPSAKVAILYQNDGFGKDLMGGFDKAIAGSGIKVVARESYEVTDPTIASQVSKLASSGADTFLNVTTPKFSAQAIAAVAKSDWKPLHLLNNVGASKALVLKPVGLQNAKGIVSTTYYKDPEDPKWTDDPAMKEYKDGIKAFSSRSDPLDPFHVYGWGAAQTMVEALKTMKKPTRAALMDAVRNLDQDVPILLPGIKVQTGPDDGYALEAMQIMKFDGNRWQLQGKVVQKPH